MTLQDIYQLLATINEKYNQILLNAKTIHELEEQLELVDTSFVHVSNNGTSEKLQIKKIIDAIVTGSLNQLLYVGEITIDGTELTVPAGVQWRIQNINFFTSSDFVEDIELCETGKIRKDIIVANTSNALVYYSGVEDESVALRPNIPLNTVLVTEINVTDSGFDYVVSNEYVQKAEFIQKVITGTGEISVVLDTQETNFVLASDDITMVEGTAPTSGYLSQFTRDDKLLTFLNKTANPIVFKHSVEEHNFRMPDAENLTVEPNELIRFRQFKDDVLCYQFDSLSRVGSSNEFRTYRTDEAGLETILELSDLTKYIENVFGSDFILTAGLFPVNGELVIKNSIGAAIELYGIANPETGDLLSINGNVIDEFTPFVIEPYALAKLKKVYQEDFVGENWILTYEFENAPNYPVVSVNGQTGVVILTKTSVGLGNVDNTADAEKPVSTPQQNALNALKYKQAAYMAITSNIALSGNPTINSVILSNGTIVLLTNQTDGKQNGLWEVQTAAWVRPSFFAVGMDVTGAIIPVVQLSGFAYDVVYMVSTIGNNIVGTDILTISVLVPKNINSYSTTEILTGGKWIDDKPIYRKVIEYTFDSSGMGVSIPHGITNLDFLITGKAIFPYSYGTLFYDINVPLSGECYVDTEFINIENTTSIADINVKFILEYTKTTD